MSISPFERWQVRAVHIRALSTAADCGAATLADKRIRCLLSMEFDSPEVLLQRGCMRWEPFDIERCAPISASTPFSIHCIVTLKGTSLGTPYPFSHCHSLPKTLPHSRINGSDAFAWSSILPSLSVYTTTSRLRPYLNLMPLYPSTKTHAFQGFDYLEKIRLLNEAEAHRIAEEQYNQDRRQKIAAFQARLTERRRQEEAILGMVGRFLGKGRRCLSF
ncbi:hypothetical protein ARMSODRAFT_89528 [Armillaria solidipes]|uniref:Uncharacterized protein n=1 Tax=Armillaria solidipes TaxID=1076256 RepID=A0A2H3C5U7_9AGAR|nr:hypothetical protein ARMSODRAFT_89528 [Armillaria solidipes]